MFLSSICQAVTGRARMAALVAGLTAVVPSCATHSTQATHIAARSVPVCPVDSFTNDVEHLLSNIKVLRDSGMFSPDQLESLLTMPSSNRAVLVQVTTDAVFGLKGCELANRRCAINALPVCGEYAENIIECPEYQTRCGGVLPECSKFVKDYLILVTNFLKNGAKEAVEATNCTTK